MNTLKAIGWYLYAVLATILTLGIFIRFHLVTVRERTLGGIRAGFWGGTHLYREDKFLVVSKMLGKKRYPVVQISYADTGVLNVSLATSGSRNKRASRKINTWMTRSVAAFINAQVPEAA
jgi:hypothetical protein